MKINIKEKKSKDGTIANIKIEGNLTLQNSKIAKETLQETISKYNIFDVTLENIESIDLSLAQVLISFFDSILNEKKILKLTNKFNQTIINNLETVGFLNQFENYTKS